MGRYATILLSPLVIALTVSGCYTQFGATQEETYAEEPEYEAYDDSTAYVEEGYEEARERFYFDYYYPTVSVGFGIGYPYYYGWSDYYYDPYWWGPGCWFPSYWYPSCAFYGYPFYRGYHYPVYPGYGYPSHPIYSPGIAAVHTRTRNFGNTRTTGGTRGGGGGTRGSRSTGTVVPVDRPTTSRAAAVDGARTRGARPELAARDEQDVRRVVSSTRSGARRKVVPPTKVRVKQPRKIESRKPIRLKVRKSGTSSKSPHVKTKAGSSGSRRTYKPSTSRSSNPRPSYGGSRGSVRSRPSGSSRPRSAPRSSGSSRGRSRR
jgi:hypothetical protein